MPLFDNFRELCFVRSALLTEGQLKKSWWMEGPDPELSEWILKRRTWAKQQPTFTDRKGLQRFTTSRLVCGFVGL